MTHVKKTVNRGALWTDEECQQLRTEFEQGISVKDIAAAHQRTPTAIEHRLAYMAAEEVIQGAPAATAASKYHVTESMVDRKVKQMQKAKQPPLKERMTQSEQRIDQLEQRVIQLEQFIAQLTNQQITQRTHDAVRATYHST